MAYIAASRVKETTTSTGTGVIALLGASPGYASFSTYLALLDTTTYCIEDPTTGAWEIGIGFLSSTSTNFNRSTILRSSNGGLVVNFAAGTKNVFITQSDRTFISNDTPSIILGAIPANVVQLFNNPSATRPMLACASSFTNPATNAPLTLQPHMGLSRVASWMPAGNSTTITNIGAAPLTAIGTATAANVANATKYSYQRRIDFTAVAATNAIVGWRNAVGQWTVGGISNGFGGFHMICRFGISVGGATATSRCFVGMGSSIIAPTDVEPSTIQNQIGVGWDAADANIQIFSAGSTVTKINLGASFVVPAVNQSQVYEIALFSPPGTQACYYQFTELSSGSTTSGTVTGGTLPPTSMLLTPRGWLSVGGTSSAIGISLMGLYVESEY